MTAGVVVVVVGGIVVVVVVGPGGIQIGMPFTAMHK